MTVQEALNKFNEIEKILNAYGHALGCLNYDGETVAPKNSAAARGETMGLLSGVVHGYATAPETLEMLETLLASEETTPLDRRRAEVLKEQCDELTLVPAEEFMAYQQLLAESGAVWREAKLSSDFAAYAVPGEGGGLQPPPGPAKERQSGPLRRAAGQL